MISYLTAILMLVGQYVIAKNKIKGLIIIQLATVLFIFYFASLNDIPNTIMEIVLLILGIRAIYFWRKEN